MNKIKNAYLEIDKWLKMNQDQVLDRFQDIPRSFGDGKGQKRFVYIPGTRKDRVLLVAHADTVFGDQLPIETIEHNGIIFSANRKKEIKYTSGNNFVTTRYGYGIGADDRAGCAALWQLRNEGHSLLITSGEENGCITSCWLMDQEYWRNEINNTHSFLIQFDRKGKNDAVFYDVGTNKFAEFIKKETGFKPAQGSSTDIKRLCKTVCGVNLSTGYYSEHNNDERLVISHWMNTLYNVYSMISKSDLPRFDLDNKDLFKIIYNNYYHHDYDHDSHNRYFEQYGTGYSNGTTGTNGYGDDYPQQGCEGDVKTSVSSPLLIGGQSTYEEQEVECGRCGNKISVVEWYESMFNCPKCGQEI